MTASNSFSVTESSDSYSGDMPGVVDEHVDLAEPVVGRVDQTVELIPPPDVHLIGQRGAAGGRGDLLGGRLTRLVACGWR